MRGGSSWKIRLGTIKSLGSFFQRFGLGNLALAEVLDRDRPTAPALGLLRQLERGCSGTRRKTREPAAGPAVLGGFGSAGLLVLSEKSGHDGLEALDIP